MKEQKVIYYSDELKNDFAESKIDPIKIDKNYKYEHNIFWRMCAAIVYRGIFYIPAYLIDRLKYHLKIVNKEVLKQAKDTGYFVYGNHTQEVLDTFIPSHVTMFRRVYVIAHPDNVSIKGMKTMNKMLGALPVPGDLESSRNFLEAIKRRVKQKAVIMVYPEAHVWPYYTKIRNYPSVSFKYPNELDVPAFCITNTYQKRKNGKVKIVCYVDGPFYADKTLPKKQAQEKLRNEIYETQVERSKNNNIEVIKYIKKDKEND